MDVEIDLVAEAVAAGVRTCALLFPSKASLERSDKRIEQPELILVACSMSSFDLIIRLERDRLLL